MRNEEIKVAPRPVGLGSMISHGPVIEDISIQPLGSPFAGIRVTGLIDTGASVVCMSKKIASKLGVLPVDKDDLDVVGGGRVPADIYSVYLSIPLLNYREIARIYAVGMVHPSQNVLLGRSFLRDFVVTFHGPTGVFTFERASQTYDVLDEDG